MTVPWPGDGGIIPSTWQGMPQMPYRAAHGWRCGQCGSGVSGYYNPDAAEWALLEHMAERCPKREARANGAGAQTGAPLDAP